MKIDEIRGKPDAELEFELGNLKQELFGLRFKMATESSANPAKIRILRRSIAQLKTVLHERAGKIRGQEPR
jgi:large subunit ribosomal protein L29